MPWRVVEVDTAIVPSLWLYEVTNVSMMAVRKGRITKAKAVAFLGDLSELPIQVEPPKNRVDVFSVLAELTERHAHCLRRSVP
jgi:hypothetical protein